MMFFDYGETEIQYLKARDKRMGDWIERTGHIYRMTDSDLFTAVIRQILGQQISSQAHATIWKRLTDGLGSLSADKLAFSDPDLLRPFGISLRKAEYVISFSQKVWDGTFDLGLLRTLSDKEAIACLTSLRGIGVWTAEMILLFGLRRPDILSYQDYGIRRGLCLLYGHDQIDRQIFQTYRNLFHPYGSIASLYLWEASATLHRDNASGRTL